MKKEKIISSGAFIALGYGEMLQIFSDIAKKLNSESKIITESKKVKDGETKITRSLSASGVKDVVSEFVKILKGTKKPVLVGGTKILYGLKDNQENDEVIESYIFSRMAKECVDFLTNPNTSKSAYAKVA